MSDGLNRVTLIGNLGRDAELRSAKSGEPVLNFSISCAESYIDKTSGERKEKTEWVNCVLWGKRGESLAQYMLKGKTLAVEGSLRTSSWEKDGVKQYKTEVNVREILLLGGGDRQQRAKYEAPADDMSTDDIPF
jgi:single-strand DNA-binding protein